LKGFIITMLLLVGTGFAVLTSYDKIAQSVVDNLIVEEGNHDAMMTAALKDPKAFTTKYQPFLQRRWLLSNIALFLDEAWFMQTSKLTLDLYADTPLTLDQAYANFMFERAKRIELTGNPALIGEAWTLYKRHQQDFPNDEKAMLVRNAISRLMTKYGMS
jgi:hypothetical protein